MREGGRRERRAGREEGVRGGRRERRAGEELEPSHPPLAFFSTPLPFKPHTFSYLDYYNTIMDSGLLKVGGCLVLDNTLYKGEELAGGPLSVNGEGIKAVNEAVLNDPRVEQVMLPLRDGVTLVYRKE